MKKEILQNILKLRRLGNELGLFVKEILILPYYLESPSEIMPKKILGLNIKGGNTDEIKIDGENILDNQINKEKK